MKTTLRHLFVISFAFIAFFTFQSLRAETDHEFETAMRQRQHDFNAYIKERNSEKSDVMKAAQVLHDARKAAEAELAENERNYQKSMKRYSMEEIEAQDRADEERLVKESAQADATRALFVESRERRRSIEASIGPLDPYQEYDINMTVEPETKVSHPGGTSGPAVGGGTDAL